MQNNRPSRGPGAGRPPGEHVESVGEVLENGELVYPSHSLAELAKALCLRVGDPTQHIYELGARAIRDRPEFAIMKMPSRDRAHQVRGKGDRRPIIEMLNSPDPEVQDRINSDNLPQAFHQDPQAMSSRLIWARLMKRLRRLLEDNINQRTTRGIADEVRHDSIPVPMVAFRQTDTTWWMLLFPLAMFLGKQFVLRTGRYAPDSSSNWATSIQDSVNQYRARHHLNADHQPQEDEPFTLVLVLARKANERREISLHQTARPPPPATYEELMERIRTIFHFPRQDQIEQIVLNCDDGRTTRIRDTEDLRHFYEEPVLSITHQHHPPPGGGIDDVHQPTYLPIGNDRRHVFGSMLAREVYNERPGHIQEDLIAHVREMARNDKFVWTEDLPGAVARAAQEDDTLGGRTGAVARAESREHEHARQPFLIAEERARELQRQRYSPYNDMRYVVPRLHDLMRVPGSDPREYYTIETGLRDSRAARGGQDHIIFKDHQRGALLYMMHQDFCYGGGIISDKAGTGKTVLIAANIVASTIFHAKLRQHTLKPTLVAAPAALVSKTIEDLHHMLPTNYRVMSYGKNIPQVWTPDGQTKRDVLFDPTNIAFVQDGNHAPSRNVIVVSLEEMSRLWDDHKDGHLEGLFDRIIIDEGHHLRRCEVTKRGALLLSMKARLTWLFTATPIVNSLEDVLGYVAFLAKDGHYTIGADDRGDRNRTFYGEKYQRAMDFYETLRPGILPAIDQVRGHANDLSNERKLKPFPDEYFDDSINSLDDLSQEQKDAMWETQNFPACKFFNKAGGRARADSIDADRRRIRTKIPKNVMSLSQATESAVLDEEEDVDDEPVPPPFNGDRIFDRTHPMDLNAAKIVTPEAVNYWIMSHLREYQLGKGDHHLQIASERVNAILQQVSFGRSHEDHTIDLQGQEQRISPNLPQMIIERKDLQMPQEEWGHYLQYDKEISALVNMDLADASKTQREANPQLRVNKLFPQGGAQSEDTDLASPVLEPPRSEYVWRTLISIHPGMWGFRYRSNDDWYKSYSNTSLAYLVAEMRELNTCNLRQKFPNKPISPQDVLTQFLFCSPIYRRMLLDAAETLMTRRADGKNNIIIYTQYPRAAIFADKLLGFCGFKTCLLLSQMGARGRWEKVKKEFNESEQPTALIVPFSLRMEGYNLHHLCRRVLCLDAPFGPSVLEQNIERVRRLGQTAQQEVTRYLLHNTFQQIREQTLVQKTTEIMSATLPGITARDEQGMREAKAMAFKALGIDF